MSQGKHLGWPIFVSVALLAACSTALEEVSVPTKKKTDVKDSPDYIAYDIELTKAKGLYFECLDRYMTEFDRSVANAELTREKISKHCTPHLESACDTIIDMNTIGESWKVEHEEEKYQMLDSCVRSLDGMYTERLGRSEADQRPK